MTDKETAKLDKISKAIEEYYSTIGEGEEIDIRHAAETLMRMVGPGVTPAELAAALMADFAVKRQQAKVLFDEAEVSARIGRICKRVGGTLEQAIAQGDPDAIALCNAKSRAEWLAMPEPLKS